MNEMTSFQKRSHEQLLVHCNYENTFFRVSTSNTFARVLHEIRVYVYLHPDKISPPPKKKRIWIDAHVSQDGKNIIWSNRCDRETARPRAAAY